MRSYKNLYPGYIGKPDNPEKLYELCLYYVGLIERILLTQKITTQKILPRGEGTSENELKGIVKSLFVQYDLPTTLGTKLLGDQIGGSTVINLPNDMISSLKSFISNNPKDVVETLFNDLSKGICSKCEQPFRRESNGLRCGCSRENECPAARNL
jgi:hypothetical protein